MSGAAGGNAGGNGNGQSQAGSSQAINGRVNVSFGGFAAAIRTGQTQTVIHRQNGSPASTASANQVASNHSVNAANTAAMQQRNTAQNHNNNNARSGPNGRRRAARLRAKLRKGRDGLLSHRRKYNVNQEITDANWKNSGILQLPTEVRKRIFYYVVGEKHVVIHASAGMRVVMDPNRQRVLFNSVTDKDYHEYHTYTLPNDPKAPPVERVRSSILRVCRAFHAEASLLLYSANTFSFSADSTMSFWLTSLKPVQRRAIRELVLPSRLDDVGRTVKRDLTGLRRLHMYLLEGEGTNSAANWAHVMMLKFIFKFCKINH